MGFNRESSDPVDSIGIVPFVLSYGVESGSGVELSVCIRLRPDSWRWRMCMRQWIICLCGFCVATVGAGCGGTYPVPIRYSKTGEVQSFPEHVRGVRILVLQFEDGRDNPNEVGKSGNKKLITGANVPSIVTSAVVDSLCKAGLSAEAKTAPADGTTGDYDVVLSGKVLQFFCTIGSGWSRLPCDTLVSVQYRVQFRNGRVSDWSKPISGTDVRKVESKVYFVEVRDFIDSALQSCVRHLVEDLVTDKVLDRMQ